MAARYTTRPLTAEARTRMTGTGTEHSPFRSSWKATEQLLDRELRLLQAHNVVMMIDVNDTDIRLDGKIRATARAGSPSAALAFDSHSKGPLLFCCGRYRTWQDNIRAVALGLEALRKIARYGIVQADEQYRGWRALNAVAGEADWVAVFAAYSGWTVDEVKADPNGAYHASLFKTHPDHGGSRDAYDDVQHARNTAILP